MVDGTLLLRGVFDFLFMFLLLDCSPGIRMIDTKIPLTFFILTFLGFPAWRSPVLRATPSTLFILISLSLLVGTVSETNRLIERKTI